MPEPNGWNEWSKFVLKELERLNTCYEKLDGKMDVLKNEVTMLKIKAGVWGLCAGVIPVAIVLAVKLL